MRYLILLVFIPPLILGAVGAWFTLGKLDQMYQIRGWKPGATTQMKSVRQKYEDWEGACWIALSDAPASRPGPHRLNLAPDAWNGLEVGDPIEVVYLPGRSEPHLRDGIYANDENIAFDKGLLAVEVAMVVLSPLGAVVATGILVYIRLAGGRKPSRRS